MKATNKQLETVRKLLVKANDPACTQAEMETFLAAANRLQLKYNIESSDVELHISDYGLERLEANRGKKESRFYESRLLRMIARHNGCKMLYSSYRKKIYGYTVIGEHDNRNLTIETFKICIEKFRSYAWPRYKEYQKEGRDRFRIELGNPRLGAYDLCHMGLMDTPEVFVESYLNGTIQGLREKLNAEKQEELSQPESKEKWGLIVVANNALVDEYTAKAFPNLGSISTSENTKMADAGYSQGVKDGNSNHGQRQLN